MRKVMGILATLVLLTAAPTAALAETLFTCTLDGDQASTTSSATGTGNFTLRDDNMLEYNISFDPLASGEIAAHFHGPAPAGQPAGVQIPLPLGSPKVGVAGPLSAQQKADLMAGLWYVNIHSNQFGSGEIRGQVLQSAVPTEDDSWSELKSRFEDR